jgi:hypothetical protein
VAAARRMGRFTGAPCDVIMPDSSSAIASAYDECHYPEFGPAPRRRVDYGDGLRKLPETILEPRPAARGTAKLPADDDRRFVASEALGMILAAIEGGRQCWPAAMIISE